MSVSTTEQRGLTRSPAEMWLSGRMLFHAFTLSPNRCHWPSELNVMCVLPAMNVSIVSGV